MMTEMTPDRILAAETALRLDVINSTVNIDTRLVKLYELVENDLLGALALSSHYISPYKARAGRPRPGSFPRGYLGVLGFCSACSEGAALEECACGTLSLSPAPCHVLRICKHVLILSRW
jgi:hypothetical protein